MKKIPTFVDKSDDKYYKYKDIVVFHSKKIAYGLGELSAIEQHIFDLLTSQINQDSNPEKALTFSIADIMDYLDIKGGTAYRVTHDNLKKLSGANLVLRDKRTKSKIKRIPIFDYFDDNRETGIISYRFSEKMEPYLFNLKSGEFYSINLATLRTIKGKDALILFRIWCARKNYDLQTMVIEEVDWWRIVFQGSNAETNPWKNYTVTLTLKKAMHALKLLFNNRYYFHLYARKDHYRIRKYDFGVLGDTSEAYPIINGEGERKFGRELALKSNSMFNVDLDRLANSFGISKREIIINSELHDLQLDGTRASNRKYGELLEMQIQLDKDEGKQIQLKIEEAIAKKDKRGNPDNDY